MGDARGKGRIGALTPTFRVAWYRFRTSLPSRWTGYVTVVVLLGLVGGLAMAAIAGARRTQSAFPAYLAATNASDLRLQTYDITDEYGFGGANLTERLERLPEVTAVASAPDLLIVPLGRNGRVLASSALNDDVSAIGSVGGEYFSQDRVTVAQGHMADPRSPDEMVATAESAKIAGWHIGETVELGAMSTSQIAAGANPNTAKPAVRFSAKLVGVVLFASQIVNDDVDRFPTYVLMTPALTRRLQVSTAYPSYGLRLRHGSADVAAVEKEIIQLLPKGSVYTFQDTAVTEGQVERASKPEAIALGVFGAIAALVTLLIAGLAISRALWADAGDLDILRALGGSPAVVSWGATLGLLAAVVVGGLLAVGIAVALSPLAPFGPAAQVDPTPGIAFDWTVLGTGFAVLVVGLGGLALSLAYRRAARRRPGVRDDPVARGSSVVELAAAGRTAAPSSGRTAFLARGRRRPLHCADAFGPRRGRGRDRGRRGDDHFRQRAQHPRVPPGALRVELELRHRLPGRKRRPPQGSGTVGPRSGRGGMDGLQLRRRPDQRPHRSSADRKEERPRPADPVRPWHTGNKPDRPRRGNTCRFAKDGRRHRRAQLRDSAGCSGLRPADTHGGLGTATLPAIGTSGSLHPSMGTGVVIPQGLEPARFKRALTYPDPNLNGPAIVVVRLRHGVPAAAGLASVQLVASAANRIMAADPEGAGDTYNVLGVQRPAEIVNYQSSGDTPAILAAGLAAGAVVSLGITLAASVRRRRRDLALLKTLGFTRRQLAVAVAWQASVAAITGIVIGVPIGIALGRWLWDLFARDIYAVPRPTVPVLEVVVVAVVTIVLANLVAALPGRMAARTPTALVLRAE